MSDTTEWWFSQPRSDALERPDPDRIGSQQNSHSAVHQLSGRSKLEEFPTLPSVSLPKGGGAIRGIDEKLMVEQPTGSARCRVPVFTSPARAGFGPRLSLSYDSGSGNGPYGIGWNLATAAITRKTSRGLPRYDDGRNSDVFILSGAEDLVPELEQSGADWSPQEFTATAGASNFKVSRYRPRVEAEFARVERWENTASGDVHWRTVSRDNVTNLFGQDPSSRIADPDDSSRVFSWLLDFSFDDRGNAINYQYKPEDGDNVPVSASGLNRVVTANRYVKRILYGNQTPYVPGGQIPHDWCFEVVFDYGEHDRDAPLPTAATTWPCRPDPFSTYRAGFEVRTQRTCKRILMFHRFAEELGPDPVIVRSTDITYFLDITQGSELPTYSLISSVVQTGWVRAEDGSGYHTGQLCPVEFGYAPLALDDTLRTADSDSLDNIVGDFDGGRRRWIDLDGEGLHGILAEDDVAWYYKANLSTSGVRDPSVQPPPYPARFGPLELVAAKPVLTAQPGALQLTGLNGHGRLCAVSFSPPVAGWFERATTGAWEPLRPFVQTANLEWTDPNLRFVDLDGDGLPDVLLTEDTVLSWHQWIADTGFAPADCVVKPFDEEHGPALVFADGTGSVFLADMSGDGLSDLVRIRNGEASYWPNLGYGRFGAKVAMDRAPVFDSPDRFDHRRVRLADIDGTGTADLIYFGSDETTIWFNRCGDSWTESRNLPQFPLVDDVSRGEVFDLLGTGTASAVWTSPLPDNAAEPLRYIDLTGGTKPYLLTTIANNLGAITTLTYAPSTRFYLDDKQAGTPWVTRLPLPVHVVARVETYEAISNTRIVSTYSYHHGFYDPTEREFRGFARVDKLDAEAIPKQSGTGQFSATPEILGSDFNLAPVWTRTWYQTGAFFDRQDIAVRLAQEYYQGDSQAPKLAGTAFSADATAEELREACRALRGRVVRQEVYAQDGLPASVHPYSTAEHRYQIDMLQPPTTSSYGAHHGWEVENISCLYERDPADPRVGHNLTLAIDGFGNVTRSASVGYPRRSPAFDQQGSTAVVYTETDYANVADQTDWYRLGLPIERRIFELTGVLLDPTIGLFDHDSLRVVASAAAQINYEEVASGTTPQRRLLKRSRTMYRRNDLSGPLPQGQVESLALVDRTYTVAYTPGLLQQQLVATSRITTAELTSALHGDGAFVDLDADGNQWAPSPRALFSPDPASPDATFARQHFYLVQGATDPWGNAFTVTYDHDLLVSRHVDAVGNVTTAQHNYRLLRPWLVTDPNLNRFGARFDALGRLVAAAVMGKQAPDGSDEGDHLDTSTTEPSATDDPTHLLDYNVDAYRTWASDPSHDPNHPTPVFSHTRVRVQHKDAATPWLETYTYTDGMGRVALAKARAEPGSAPERDAAGTLVRDSQGALVFAPTSSRWVGTGRVVYDNKANPVKAYEPFFDSSPAFDDEGDLVDWGVTAIARYDPSSRLIRIDNPDGTYRTTTIGPWRAIFSDENDTVLDSAWYAKRQGGGLGADQADAAAKTAAHAATPSVVDMDVLGRHFRSVQDDGPQGQLATAVTLDIEGQARATTDAVGRLVLATDYDMFGRAIHHASIDTSERWLLHDAAGRPLLAWDSRGHRIRREYDVLRRPINLYVSTTGAAELLAEQTTYGESLPLATGQQFNLRGGHYQERNEAGLCTIDGRDFKGNALSTTRRLLTDYVDDVDWSQTPALNEEQFTTTATFDALNRLLTLTTPDTSVTTNAYGERSLIASVSVRVRGAPPTTVLAAAAYDAIGRTLTVELGNGATATRTYDAESLRLVHMQSTRPAASEPLQDLTYAYDAVGNVTRTGDAAQPTLFFSNQVVSGNADFTYDAIYRLTRAAGREQIGQADRPQTSWDDGTRSVVPLPTDGQAMRNYVETYVYDPVGNIASLAHSAANGSWTRTYAYDEPHAPPRNSHLTSTTVGSTTESYAYDAHGNITGMPQLSFMSWDWKDQLRATASQRVNAGTPETTYYRYGGPGARARKTTQSSSGTLGSDRIYLGDYEVYREFSPAGAVTLERQSLHVHAGATRIALIETPTVDASRAAPAATSLFRYELGNQLGSAALELDSGAAIVSYEEYYPYGSTSFQTGRSAAEVSLKRYRFIGKERDAETGLYFLSTRYYASWLGRWISPDPAGFTDGLNLFRYCADNPVSARDRSGLQQEHLRRIGTSGAQGAQERALEGRLSRGQGTPEEALHYFQAHGHPELQTLPAWDPSLHLWVWEKAPEGSQSTAQQQGAGGQGATGAPSAAAQSGAQAGGTTDRTGLASSPSVGRQVVQEAARPESNTGARPRGTLHTWSGKGKADAEALVAKGKGWMMGNIEGHPTPQHAKAEEQWADAEAAYAPGRVPEPVRDRIWGPPSAKVVGRAALAGHAVQGHGTPAANSIQPRFEDPARARWGGVAGSLAFGTGMFTAITGGQDPNPAVAIPLVLSGVGEATSGIIFGAGAYLGAAEAMSIGSAGATFFGGAGAAIGFGVASARSFERGDNVGGVVNALGAIGGLLLIASLFTPVGWVGLLGLGLVAFASGFNIGRWLAN